MGDQLSPFVYWAQTESSISLHIDLKDVQSPEVVLNEDELEFTAVGLGAKGRNEYHFVLEFFLPVDFKASQFRVKDRDVEFSILKKTNQWWPRLTVDQKKPAWLKIDFEKWKSEDDEDVDQQAVDEAVKQIFDPEREEAMRDEAYKKIYLFVYNLFQFSGFAIILALLLFFFIRDGTASHEMAFTNVGALLIFFQTFQLFEIVFGYYGWTGTKNIIIPIIQIIGRLIVLICFVAVEPRMHNQPVVFHLFMIWSTIEVIRYPFYLLKICGIEFGALTWVRHTIWIPLYPLGFICEGTIILRNIPFYEETKRFCFHLPNALNWSFDLPSMMRVYLLFIAFPLMFTLMSNMYRQRVRVLESLKRKTD